MEKVMNKWASQVRTVVGLEIRKTFFSRRGLWVYLLALAPALLWLVHSIDTMRDREHHKALALAHPVSTAALHSIKREMTKEEVEAKLGEPYAKSIRVTRRGDEVAIYRYTDGDNDLSVFMLNGTINNLNEQTRDSLAKDSVIFATVFQFFYLRLAIFFGCVGIFTNLFRAEMLEKSLHFYLLSPIRREVLLIGKYLAGLIATVTIFTTGTALQLAALLWHLDPVERHDYLQGPGWHHIAAYLGVTALACLGYGSVFLTAGMLFRNPIIPAVVVLQWEFINLFLPGMLKKISVIFYLQSLCPVVAPPDQDLPLPLRLLISSAEPVGAVAAIAGLSVVTLGVLAFAAMQARKLEINYSTD
jgi:ABC-type transport system involved in multi-copper enzyme maturation permease subunit